ncbi:MAG: demethoxyubiquinone hydroxylase family protein [Acidobacteria bacterium]|nr:demethoxyubiquinone hydroxylase family protein [Acidobacteriota bacterium]
MGLTDPFVGLVPRKMTDTELARAIRQNVAAEVDAINLYAAHMDATDNESARRILSHIIDEEKEHLAEFLELLKILDPTQALDIEKAGPKVRAIVEAPTAEAAHEAHDALEASDDAVEAAETAPVQIPGLGKSPTVGSLRKQ